MTQRIRQDRAAGIGLVARAWFCGLALFLAACGERAPTLTYKSGEVVAEGWSGPAPAEGWEHVLVVRASEDPDAPAMLGEYNERDGVITFTPRFAPSPGVRLHATFHVKHHTLEAGFVQAAVPVSAETMVAHIYPSADVWPANTLKMYIVFSAPMSAGEAYTHLSVRDDEGRVIAQPFVEIEPELWDATGARLTLLFDPGRIKRGLVDNEQSGPPLMDGRKVTIEVDPSWRDARGAPLAKSFTKSVQVGKAVRETIDVKRWTIAAPAAGSADLVVTFDRPLDHALAQRAISVTKDGAPLAGKSELSGHERTWRFTPDAPWAAGGYYLLVDGVLEDLAGNRPGKLFDVDTADPGQSSQATPLTALAFTVAGS